MQLPSDFVTLFEEAQAEAKRRGHNDLTILHVAAALMRRDPERMGAEVGTDVATAATSSLDNPPPLSGDSVVDVSDLLRRAAGSPDRWAALYQELERRLPKQTAPPPATTAAHAAGVSGSPTPAPGVELDPAPTAVDGTTGFDFGRVSKYVELVSPSSDVVGREEFVDKLIGMLGRQMPATPAVVGVPGAGRTTVFDALAAKLANSSYTGSLAGMNVVRVHAESIIADDRARALSRVVEDIGDKAVLVFDDLEVLCGLGGMSADLAMMSVIRSVVGRGRHKVVVTLAESYASKLDVHDAELSEELSFIKLPDLGKEHLQDIAARRAADLAAFHKVSVPPDVAKQALTPPAPNSTRTHPGLLIERLDSACASAALRSDRVVTIEDLNIGSQLSDTTYLDRERLVHRLSESVIGQQPAIERVASRLALTRAQLDLNPHRPDGVFLLIGPTGVGKTALARALANVLYGHDDALIRLDMSEYAHDWAVSRLIGPQPGFVGYTEPEGWLTTKVREAPSSIILLDEIEKAHPTVWNTFLQVFDAGRLTDARGQVADFGSAVIVMTSNIGSEAFRTLPLGFHTTGAETAAEERVIGSLKSTMTPELINRIDEVIVFHPLTRSHIADIAAREIDQALGRLAERGYQLQVDPEVMAFISESGYDPAYGARHLQRNVERLLLQSLVEARPGNLRATLEGDVVRWNAR